MAADIRMMTEALKSFYDFSDKTVLLVGAGGGQLLDGVSRARKLIAIDQDAAALQAMELVAKTKGMDRGGVQTSRPQEAGSSPLQDCWVETIHADWSKVNVKGDVVYFEFCLHEMENPHQAILHAQSLAPEIIVFDHLPHSEWARCAGEAEIVRRSTEALHRCHIKRSSTWQGEQHFSDYAELWGRLSQAPRTQEADITEYRDRRDFTIPMSCGFTLL